MCCFQDAIDSCCECKDDGTAALKQPFMHQFLDARAADFRKPMHGAIDFSTEETEDGGVKTVQVTYPLEYMCIGGTPSTTQSPISPLQANTQSADLGK